MKIPLQWRDVYSKLYHTQNSKGIFVMKNVFTDEDVAKLVQLWQTGVKVREIASEMGRPYNNIRNKVKELQAKGVIHQRVKGEVQEALPEGYAQTLAEAYSVSQPIVEAFIKLIGANVEEVFVRLPMMCEAWVAQQGVCYYASSIPLATDGENGNLACPILMSGEGSQPVLVSLAMARVRGGLTHQTFLRLCREVTTKFN